LVLCVCTSINVYAGSSRNYNHDDPKINAEFDDIHYKINLIKIINVIDAWVIYNGVADSMTNESGITSVTKNNTGDYTFVYDKSFSDTGYVISISVSNQGATGAAVGRVKNNGITTSSCTIEVVNLAGNAVDCNGLSVTWTGKN